MFLYFSCITVVVDAVVVIIIVDVVVVVIIIVDAAVAIIIVVVVIELFNATTWFHCCKCSYLDTKGAWDPSLTT